MGTGQQVKSQFAFHYLSLSQLIATASRKLDNFYLTTKKREKTTENNRKKKKRGKHRRKK
jgi:pantothenate kinase-related protein Tda10